VPDWIALWIEEDLGPGDVTSDAIFGPRDVGRGRIVARERAVLSGMAHATEVFRRLGAKATPRVADGAWAGAGDEVLRVEGPARAILAGERLALNLVARMSGIATATRTLQDLLAGAGGRGKVAGTRKTTPGFRAFEKEAIRAGGGDPHRMGLFDEAMVKDNHREALGGDVAAAVRRVRAAHPGVPVTCEVESQADALTAAEAGADWILIDNQAPETGRAWAEAVRAKHPRVRIEASGGIGPHDVAAYAWADRVSMGWLTQRAPARDFGLDWLPTEGKQHT
jgi:nicotinate-nucleotide pyrophosphorylase (carboxylating)